jgi:tol-pal system protein YbgF
METIRSNRARGQPMKAMRGEWKAGAALVVGLGVLSCLPALAATPATLPPGVQVIDAKDLMARLQRLERDMRDVQAETFKKPPGAPAAAAPASVAAPAAGAAAGAAAAAIPAPEAPQQASMMPDLNPLIRRMEELEDGITRLTGQMEEIGHQVDQLSQKTERLQKQLDYQAMQTNGGAIAQGAPAGAPAGNPSPAPEGTALASLTPPDQATPALRGTPPANLGQIPANAPLPALRPADAKGEFDTAMNLLSRAQYDPARDAFRKFADGHPEDDRAADALYWTGDIAYSAKKDYPGAARDFAELLKKYPKAQRAPEGMLKLGLALFELGQMKEGCAALVALPAKYPDATAAVAARAKSERTNNKCK